MAAPSRFELLTFPLGELRVWDARNKINDLETQFLYETP